MGADDLLMSMDDAERWHAENGGEPTPGGREPPWSNEAEQSVLGGLLIDAAKLPLVIDIVVPLAFYRLEHRLIFEAVCALVSRSEAVDIVTVFEELRAGGDPGELGGLKYLNQLAASVPSAAHIRRYAEIVAEKHAERLVIQGAEEMQQAAWAQGLDVDARLERIASALSRVQQQRKNPGTRVPMVRLGALRESAARVKWVVKHVVPAESIGIMFGGSGTFKSFIAVDCALHVAHGLPWMGRKCDKGSVLYIAAEGGAGLWNRIDAWHRARNLAWEDADMVVVPVAVDLAADAWRVVEAAQAVGITPSLVVVDTLSQTFMGEENAAPEVSAYLRELGLRFRALWQASVMVIHHSGHQATERPRGSSALRANVDYMFGVFRDEKEMLATMSCVKQKDGELFRDAMFQLSVGQLGLDEDGDPITSLVAKHLGTEVEVAEAREREAAAGRSGRTSNLLQLVVNGMQESALRKAFYADVVDGLDADARKHAYSRARKSAIEGRQIEIVEGIVIDLRGRS